MLSKRSVDSKQKNRRCSAKESTILFKRSDDAKRKQSIYSQISLNCYAVEGSNTGQKHSRIIVFPLGFRKVFFLLPSCLWIHLEQHNGAEGEFGKDTCFSDEIKYPYKDSCKSLSHSWQGKGSACHIPQLPQCMDRVILYNPQSISAEPFSRLSRKSVGIKMA